MNKKLEITLTHDEKMGLYLSTLKEIGKAANGEYTGFFCKLADNIKATHLAIVRPLVQQLTQARTDGTSHKKKVEIL